MISIRKVTTQAEFDGLEPVWNSLLESSASKTIALTWEWQSTWWAVFGRKGRELNILVTSQNGEIVGIAPLLKRSVLHYGLLFTRLEFIGTGEDEAEEICSEYLDFIIRHGLEADVTAAIMRYVREVDDSWDEIALEAIDAASESPAKIISSQNGSSAQARVVSKEAGSY
ncbi:MAG TPA: hypothetical protein VI756_19920, partial [Blastocatellia bacterium]